MALQGHRGNPFLSSARPATNTHTSVALLVPKIPTPTSWAEIKNLLSAYDKGTWEMYESFGTAARKLLFGAEDLNSGEKKELWDVSVLAAVALCESIDPGKFPLPSESDMRKAWASALDGRELQPTPKKEAQDAP